MKVFYRLLAATCLAMAFMCILSAWFGDYSTMTDDKVVASLLRTKAIAYGLLAERIASWKS